LQKNAAAMKGRITKSTGSWYEVLAEDNKQYACRVRGKFRLDEKKESNPVAVGDYVMIELENEVGSIIEILPRQNHILRQSVKKTGHASVLAANVDQVMLIATCKQPRTSWGFIDRFLVAAESFRIPQILVFNKRDILTQNQLEELLPKLNMYESIGVTTQVIAAEFDSDISTIQTILKGKTTLVAGHSGVGKSTLLNRLSPEIGQSTGIISGFSDKGTHTTTFAEMFRLDETTFIIDTPGIKEWGLVDMEPQEISDYFQEMRDLRLNCKFGARCLHINEPKCAIIEAVEKNQIALSRYESYLSMALGEDNRK
jgi:ribosome biogenesis GTPase / thiamine phosphate phosphatase